MAPLSQGPAWEPAGAEVPRIAMHGLELILALLVVTAALAPLARRIQVPFPVLLVIGGLALALVPGLPAVRLDPEVVFLVFVPPLLYWAAINTSSRDLRRNL